MGGLILFAEISGNNDPDMMLHPNSSSSLLAQAAPEFSLPDTEGALVSLQDLKGQKVVLVFLRHFA